MELHDFSPIRNDYPILSFHPSLSANMRALSSICVKGVCRLNRKQEVPNLPLQIKYMQNEEQPECTWLQHVLLSQCIWECLVFSSVMNLWYTNAWFLRSRLHVWDKPLDSWKHLLRSEDYKIATRKRSEIHIRNISRTYRIYYMYIYLCVYHMILMYHKFTLELASTCRRPSSCFPRSISVATDSPSRINLGSEKTARRKDKYKRQIASCTVPLQSSTCSTCFVMNA